MKYLKILVLCFFINNAFASLENCKTDIIIKYKEIELYIYPLMKLANIALVPNPLIFRKEKFNAMKTEQDCLDFKTTWFDPIYSKKQEYLDIVAAENQIITDCEGYKNTIKNATYTQFSNLTDAKKFEHIFRALMCLSK